VWNPDEPQTMDFYSHWKEVGAGNSYDNGFKVQWEMFLRHVCEDAPFPHGLMEGAKGVQLAEAALQSWRERRWIDVPPLEA
jgi:predicted dehydrogenase